MADDEIDINPRPPIDVGRRLVILASVLRRCFLEEDAADEALGDEIEDEQFDILAWLDDVGLTIDLEPFERTLLETGVGFLETADLEEGQSESQRAQMLGWYLNLIPQIPPYDDPELTPGFLDLAPATWDSVDSWLRELISRDMSELADARELAEIWYWRSTIEYDRRVSSGRERTMIDNTIREAATEAVNARLFNGLNDNDFPLGGGSLVTASEDLLETVTLISEERLRALNWICGFGESWSKVPLDV